MIQRTPNDPAWYKGGLWHDDEPFGVPSLWWMSWYDVSISPNLALFNHVREHAEDPEVRENQYALIAPVASESPSATSSCRGPKSSTRTLPR